MYSSTLAYIVDANNGRSATAVATNSAFRGVFAFIATEIAVPMQVRSLRSLLLAWFNSEFCFRMALVMVCLVFIQYL